MKFRSQKYPEVSSGLTAQDGDRTCSHSFPSMRYLAYLRSEEFSCFDHSESEHPKLIERSDELGPMNHQIHPTRFQKTYLPFLQW